ncbi:MAG: hypothetical protein Ta2B_08850 [Termitinemataceae bacterium]|nr:MAG: hypothetical protein Ta2B_08850 [Termitinemataceae bacterium]
MMIFVFPLCSSVRLRVKILFTPNAQGLEQQKAAVTCGLWPLYRYDPRLKDEGKNPFQLDSKEASTSLEDFMYKEVRFKSLKATSPDRADALLAKAKKQAERVTRSMNTCQKVRSSST